MKVKTLVLSALMASLLAACGGGGSASGDQTSANPIVKISTVRNTNNNVWNYYAGDLNGDGLEDIVVGGWGYDNPSANLYILMQNADGTLTDKTSVLLPDNKTDGNNRTIIADFDGDGITDIFIPGYRDGSIAVPASSVMFWGQANGPYVKERFEDGAMGHGACTADINSDGKLDIFVSGVGIYLNNGNRQFTAQIREPFGTYSMYFESCAAIKNTDETIVYFGNIRNWAAPRDKIVRFGADGSVTNITETQFDMSVDSIDVVAVDLTGDGYKDFVVADNTVAAGAGGSRYVMMNNTDGTFSKSTILSSPAHSEYYGRELSIDGLPGVFFGGDTFAAGIYKGLLAYLPDSLKNFTGSSERFVPAFVYMNSTSGNLYMLKLQNNTFYSQKME